MTARQLRFIDEYLIDLNATQAAIRAGYSKKVANREGSRLLSKADIQAAIQAKKKHREKRTEITCDKVVSELAYIGFSDARKLFDSKGRLKPITDWDDATAAAVASVEVSDGPLGVKVTKLRLWDKKGGLELLGRHLGLFEQTINLKGKIDMPSQVNVAALTNDQLRSIQESLAPVLAAGPRSSEVET